MTISVYTSADRIVRFAYQDCGLVEQSGDPSADQLGNGLQRLNDIVNVFQLEGCKLHLIQDVSVTLVANQTLYSFGPTGTTVMTRPLRVEDAYYADANGVRRPLDPISRNTWDRLSQVTGNPGAVVNYYVEKLATLLRVNVWSPPSTTEALGTLHLVFRTQAGNYTNVSDTILFPIEWYMALRWALAEDLASGQPDSVVQRCATNAGRYKSILEGWDTEDAPTSFQPDPQAGYGGSRFS